MTRLTPHASRLTPRSSGIALVITLIFVSVTAFLAITFLIVTQRERGSVAVEASQTDARFAADTALERAKVDILAPILAYNDPTRYGVVVSTNFINPGGFNNGLAGIVLSNVNYDYTTASAKLTPGQMQTVIANLQYNPRAPVYVRNTQTPTAAPEFRYYLDLNRNGRFDRNGSVPVINAAGQYVLTSGAAGPLATTNGPPPAGIQYQFQIGDPEWIGILERPEFPHSSSNRFVARYAYLVVPEGQTLDVNYMHNAAASQSFAVNNDGYMRNQGVGSWEINLAAFLADLNPNIWDATPSGSGYYQYLQPGFANQGLAFQDAQSILAYRYANNYNSLNNVQQMFGATPGNAMIQLDSVDEYSDGPLQTNVANITETANPDITTRPWAGADNPNTYFAPEDLFTKTSFAFSNRLYSAGTSNDTFNSTTFYRLTAQLGADSSVGKPRMNLNYDNLVQANSQGLVTTTNFLPWRPLDFFTNAASRLLSTLPTNSYGLFTVTNIPVLSIVKVTGVFQTNFQYTAAVHRLMQVAANLYDATTTTNVVVLAAQTAPFLPSVFRPIFTKNTLNGVTNLYISSYEQVTNDALAKFNMGCYEAEFIATNTAILDGIVNSNIYDVPWVVGAKTGLPNYNEFELLNGVEVSRKLEFQRKSLNGSPDDPNNPVTYTNQLFSLTLTNAIGNESWNSYAAAWGLAGRPLRLILTNEFTLSITNTNSLSDLGFNYTLNFVKGTNDLLSAGIWPGYSQALPNLPANGTFRVEVTNSMIATQANIIRFTSPTGFIGVSNRAVMGASAGLYPLPRWRVNLSTRVRYALMDEKAQQIVDYVALSKTEDSLDLAWELAGETNHIDPDGSADGAWYTNQVSSPNPPGGLSWGLWNQMLICLGRLSFDSTAYNKDTQYGFQFFAYNLGFLSSPNGDATIFRTNIFYSPYDPYRTVYQHVAWEANDPLVHSTVADLTDLATAGTIYRTSSAKANVPPGSLGKLNARYQPWGGNPSKDPDANGFNVALKDPLMFRPDNWQFPTNKLPSIGWLGRVHRGTPWQTLYLKAGSIGVNDWKNWSGNPNDIDAATAMPTNDWAFLDLFTAAPDDNADRGRLSVNQTNLAAWSAVLSGVITLTNDVVAAFNGNKKPDYAAAVIQPAANQPQLQQIVNGINAMRSSTNFNGSFKHIGDVFATPELTTKSPYLDMTALTGSDPKDFDINDAAMERIPQQIAGLLRNDDARFVVYAYGQSLKPADQSIVQPSGLCTNYQVTGEVAIRSVINVKPTGNGGYRTEVENFNLLPPD